MFKSRVKKYESPVWAKTSNGNIDIQLIYNKKTKTYISQDVGSQNGMGSHNGGVWKMAKTPEGLSSKEKRMGTYDADLNRVCD